VPKEVIRTGKNWEGKMSFSQGIKHGSLVFVSGQGALDTDGNVVGKGDVKAQTRQALNNMAKVLKNAGASLNDVVKVTAFITNRSPGMIQGYDAVFGEFFPTDCPASTLVEVKSLVLRDMMVEIEAIAVIG
jgi:2-iminobutanoate/2-iminopropanoate deaminase